MSSPLLRSSRFAIPLLAAAALLISLALPCPAAEAPATLAIGAPAPDFALPGVDGATHTLKEYAAAKVLALVFTCNHCPTAQAYEARLARLHADYQDKGVALVAVSPNDPRALRLDELGYTDLSDSLEEMKLRARERGFKFPYLYDGETQAFSRACGVAATPHLFIFDAARRLRYQGRIDDSDVREVTSHDARVAIDALLAGRPVPLEKTRVFGCSTKWAAKREDAKKSLEKWRAEPVELTGIDAAAAAVLAKNDTPKLRLVNIWATWCGPCVAELDELVTINRMYRKRPFETITVGLDVPEQRARALATLKEKCLSGTNYLYQETDKDKLAEALDKEWQGPLPHTVLIAPGGKVIYRKTGGMDPLELKRAIVNFLGRTY